MSDEHLENVACNKCGRWVSACVFCIIGDKIARVFLKDGVCDQEAYVPNDDKLTDAGPKTP
jgi:hypothetical protein